MLPLDGAWRAGYNPSEICQALQEKVEINEKGKWPDPTTLTNNQPFEHIK